MKKKLLASVLVVLMLGSTVGCSSSSTNTSTDNTTTTETTDSMDSAASETDTSTSVKIDESWATPYPDTVTLTTVTSESSSATYPQGDDVTSNVWTRAYKDRFNIELKTTWVSDEYDTKINLAIASKSLPDAFHVTGAQLKQLVNANMLADLTEAYDTTASDTVKKLQNADPTIFDTGKFDNKLYAITQLGYGYISQPNYIWIRSDWKEALNLPDPKSMDDVETIAKAFMKEYGGYGISSDKTLEYLNMLAPAWQAHPGIWVKDSSGELVYGSTQPEMKTALTTFARWYDEGIINRDFATLDYTAMIQGLASGEVGIEPFYNYWGFFGGPDIVKNLGSDGIFLPYMIPSATDKPVQSSFVFDNQQYTVVSKDCKNPEAAIKLINFYAYMMSDSIGKEDNSPYITGNMNHISGAFNLNNPLSDYDNYVNVTKALETNDTSHLVDANNWSKYNEAQKWINDKDVTGIGSFLQMGNGQNCSYYFAKQIVDNNEFIKDAMWGTPPDSLTSHGSTLDDILIEGFTKIIIGSESIDTFESVVANWKSAGGEQVTKDVNDTFNK